MAIPSRIGRFEVERCIGKGGMGTVYLARDPSLERLVAIKLLHNGLESEIRERFAGEARAIARLKHENIITIFEVGQHEGEPFIAMEYIAGATLGTEIGQRPIPVSLVLRRLEHLCAALEHAHKCDIIHRDIKPSNIMITEEGVLKILDFGIARHGDSSRTQMGMQLGTVAYMSPEQTLGTAIDRRTDIFAVGAVAYEMLSHRKAFPDGVLRFETMEVRPDSGIFSKFVTNIRVPLADACAGLDAAVIGIVEKALEIDPTARYQDAAAMRQDVARVRRLIESAEIQEHLATAGAALLDEDVERAIAACQQVLDLDPYEPRALELLARSRADIEKRCRERIAACDTHLRHRDLSAAGAALEHARTLETGLTHPELRARIDELCLKIAEARERAEWIGSALQWAQYRIDAGDPDAALQAVENVLRFDVEEPVALSLKARAEADIAERGAEEARRAAEEARQAEESRRAAEQTRQAEEARRATEEARRLEEARRAEDARRAAEQARRAAAEALRIEEARRAAEEARRAAEAQRALTEAAREAAETLHLAAPAGHPPTAADDVATVVAAAVVADRSVTTASPRRLSTSVSLAIAIGLAGALGLTMWLASRDAVSVDDPRPATAAPPAAVVEPNRTEPPITVVPGTLSIDAVPWAEIVSVVDARGQAIALEQRYTPVVLSLSPGEYRVTGRDPVSSSTRTEQLTVSAAGSQRVVFTFRTIDAGEYLRSIGWGAAQ